MLKRERTIPKIDKSYSFDVYANFQIHDFSTTLNAA